MKFRTTLVVLIVAVVLGGYVYFHEVQGGKVSAKRREQASKLLGVEAAQIAALRIDHSGTHFDLQKKAGSWYLLQPLQVPCDPRVIAAFLDTLAAARREDAVGRGDLVRYGLDAPASVVEIDAGGKTRRLQFGSINPLQTSVYVLVDDSKEVVLTTSALLTGSLNSAFGWRDKRMIDVDPEQVQRMSFRTIRNGDVAIRRDPKLGWQVEGPVPWRVDPNRAQSLLSGLAHLDAIGVGAENKADATKLGIDSRRFSAVVEAADGRKVGDLVLGFADGKGAYFAIVPDKPEVFRVDATIPDLWVSIAADPRDRKALPPFIPDRVTRVRVQTADDAFELRRRSAVDWKVVASQRVDSTFAIASGAVDGMLTSLATLEVAGFPAQQPSPALYEPTEIQVLLYTDAGPVSGIEIGRKDPHSIHLFARGPGEPAVFWISPSALLDVPFDLDRLKPEGEPAPESADHG
jgi:hypothetical protein